MDQVVSFYQQTTSKQVFGGVTITRHNRYVLQLSLSLLREACEAPPTVAPGQTVLAAPGNSEYQVSALRMACKCSKAIILDPTRIWFLLWVDIN